MPFSARGGDGEPRRSCMKHCSPGYFTTTALKYYLALQSTAFPEATHEALQSRLLHMEQNTDARCPCIASGNETLIPVGSCPCLAAWNKTLMPGARVLLQGMTH
jgi:hypothetical protein